MKTITSFLRVSLLPARLAIILCSVNKVMPQRGLGRFAWLAHSLLCACLLLPLWGPQASAQSDELIAKSKRAKEAMSAGRFEEAATLYSELVRAVPGNPGLIINLGLALHSVGQYQKAIVQFQAVLKQEP